MPYQAAELPEDPVGCKAAVSAAFARGDARMSHMEDSQKELKDALAENTAMTGEVIGILEAMKGGIKVLGWLGSFLKWGAGVAGAVYTIYCIIKGKSPF
jgi:hypothetical protein